MNAPDRFDLFLLADGEKKVTEQPDTRVSNCSIFLFKKEDHTMGNMLRMRLLKSEHVLFSAYKVAHPLIVQFELRVQTDGEITPREAVVQACRDLVQDLGQLSREFTKEVLLRKATALPEEEDPKTEKKAGADQDHPNQPPKEESDDAATPHVSGRSSRPIDLSRFDDGNNLR